MSRSVTATRPAIDERELAGFRAGLRRRYSDEDILAELRACAGRVGRSPTMRELAADPRVRIHPQTIVQRFGSWNAAKREAGLVARRFATREELLEQLRALGRELRRTPTGRDLDDRRETLPSKSTYRQVFGSLSEALREAGFDVPAGDERLERAVADGVRLARRLRRLPRIADWGEARHRNPRMLSQWQVRRLFAESRGAWPRFQFLVRARLLASGFDVAPDGRVRAARPGSSIPR
jgi:hypothetical protein